MYKIKWLISDIKWAICRAKLSKTQREVVDIVCLLESHDYHKVKQYIKDLRTEEGAKINGYIVNKDVHCYLIWKPTDIGEHPEWKGEPLLMIIPQWLEDKFAIANVVKNSCFHYM